ncbi:MAG: hypothetical protein RSB55_10580, partial [Oscillospiraceae bacterium]
TISVNADGAVTLSLSAEVLELTPEAPIPPAEPDIPSVEVPPAPPAEEVTPGLPPETAGDPPAAMEEVKGEAAPVLTATAPAAPLFPKQIVPVEKQDAHTAYAYNYVAVPPWVQIYLNTYRNRSGTNIISRDFLPVGEQRFGKSLFDRGKKAA